MLTMKSSEDVISLSEFRNNLSSRVEQTRRTGRPLLLTQNGHAAGVFIGPEAWDDLQEQLEKMSTYADILVSEGESDRGEVIGHDDFFRTVRSRRKSRTSKLERMAV